MEGQKVVKVFCHEEESIKDFNKLNEQLFDSANNANAFANILMPINVNLGNLSYVACAILGSILAISGVTSLTLGALASFLQLNKSFSHPISQVSQQLNSIIMALAGAERVFSLLDEKPEVDNGYVTLVNATEDEEGNIKECEEHTGIWAWKHPHGDGTVTLTKLLGDVTFNDVDFGYNEEKTILHNIKLYAEYVDDQDYKLILYQKAEENIKEVKSIKEIEREDAWRFIDPQEFIDEFITGVIANEGEHFKS